MAQALKTQRRLAAVILGAAFGLGCGHTTATNGVYATAPQTLTVDANGEPLPMPPGIALHPGQVFALNLKLEQPAHVYVIHRRGGLLEGLYPSVGVSDSALPAGEVRLPGGEAWMRVPDLQAQSQVCILLSADPVDAQKRRCVRGRHSSSPPIQILALPVSPTR